MRRGFYSRIAVENIRKNTRLYIPRILAEAGLLGCFYILYALAVDDRLAEAVGGAYLAFFMTTGACVIGVLSFILILYCNSFLMKQRKREYGLYNVLGMEKSHIIRVLFCESLCAALLSILAGLCFGVLFYKLSSLAICRLLHSEIVAGFYYIKANTILFPAVIFLAMDGLAFLVNSVTILRLKPVELLAGRHMGEKEPRVRWVLLVIGLFTLGAGYAIALTTQSPLAALALFFAAVFLVIIGTYCLYVTGTTFILKCLKKNRRYYYNKRHMPTVSGLLFRMKQNAVGLASIALLATGVLVMISTTVSLYSGVQDTVDSNYPKQLYLSAYQEDGESISHIPPERLQEIVEEAAKEKEIRVGSVEHERSLSVSYLMDGDSLITEREAEDVRDMERLTEAVYITEDTYARLKNDKKHFVDSAHLGLQKDEIAFCQVSTVVSRIGDVPKMLRIHGKEYRIKETLSSFPIYSNMSSVVNVVGIVVADDAVLEEIYRAQKEAYGFHASEYSGRIGVSFADEAAVSAIGMEFNRAVTDKLKAAYPGAITYTLDTKWEALQNDLDMNGTFLFLGILLGFVCLFSTILIIYYKQISEGYEDRERFQIMEKIGMEPAEVRKVIGSQLVMQFFLPLLTAAIHTAVAFPILLKLLKVLMLANTQLFILCTAGTLAVFAVVYVGVYCLTARTYYKIVHEG